MLFHSFSPREGYVLELSVTPFWPSDPAMRAEDYREHLRDLWRRSPELFTHLARRARTEDLTLLSTGRPELLVGWYVAVVATARRQGWEIGGVSRANENVALTAEEMSHLCRWDRCPTKRAS